MFFIMLKYLFLFNFFRLCLFASVVDIDNPFIWINAEDPSEGKWGAVINGTFYQTVKSYYCRTSSNYNQELLVYGARAWTFPLQDVNLTLHYPQAESDRIPELTDHTITELQVMLYMDGSDSRGFITRGGLLQKNISMTFIVSNVTRLSYHFWLYGVQRPPPSATENYNTVYHQMC